MGRARSVRRIDWNWNSQYLRTPPLRLEALLLRWILQFHNKIDDVKNVLPPSVFLLYLSRRNPMYSAGILLMRHLQEYSGHLLKASNVGLILITELSW